MYALRDFLKSKKFRVIKTVLDTPIDIDIDIKTKECNIALKIRRKSLDTFDICIENLKNEANVSSIIKALMGILKEDINLDVKSLNYKGYVLIEKALEKMDKNSDSYKALKNLLEDMKFISEIQIDKIINP